MHRNNESLKEMLCYLFLYLGKHHILPHDRQLNLEEDVIDSVNERQRLLEISDNWGNIGRI